MPSDTLKDLHHLPNPQPQNENKEKFKKFDEIYSKNTEQIAGKPSKTAKLKEHKMPFSVTARGLNNTKLVIMCHECLKWRCMYAQNNLTETEVVALVYGIGLFHLIH